MNVRLIPPPDITGDTQRDLNAMNKWCHDFYIQLKRIMYIYNSYDSASDNGGTAE